MDTSSKNIDGLKNLVIDEFVKVNDVRPVVVSAPGRINIIGEHTDYNQGLVLPAAIDKRVILALGKHDNDKIKIKAINFDEELELDLTQLPTKLKGWQGYVNAIIHELQSRDLQLTSFSCVFSSDIPIGAGMSSSAALCCGIIGGLDHLFGWDLEKLEIAKIAWASEHRLGANVGLMDQFAVMFGAANKAILLDCLDYSHQYIPLQLEEYSLLLINTNVKHELVDSAYNERRASCEQVLDELQQHDAKISSLRDITLAELGDHGGLFEEGVKRVGYVIRENERVHKTVEALRKKDLLQVGELMYQSHEGLSKEYEVSCSELDLLVDLTKNESAILGARMMGGGFGGCTINLIKSNVIMSTVERVMAAYQEKTQIRAEYYRVLICDGVNIIS